MVNSNQNTLEISLDESVLFLSQSRGRSKAPLSLRGQLTLTLVKPISITSIEVVFEGKSRAEWTEPGIGHQQVKVSDAQVLLQQKAVVYEASIPPEPPAPRARSVGPSENNQGSTTRRRRLTIGTRGLGDSVPLLSAPPEGSFPFPPTPSTSNPPGQERVGRVSPTTPSPPQTPAAYSPVDEFGSPPASPILSPAPTVKRHFSFTSALHGLVHRPSQMSHARSEEPPPEGEERQRKRFRDVIKESHTAVSDFLPGIYVYPISFEIPRDSPPSQHCPCGLIKYRLKAYVHRPGPFAHKLTASADVTLVSCPSDPERIDLSMRGEWEETLAYRLFLPTKRWPIGSKTPISIMLTPLVRMRVLRMAVQIEEIISYKATGGKNTLTEPPRHFTLLALKHADDHTPLFPIESDSADTLSASPIFPYIDRVNRSVDCDLLKPEGPWRLNMELEVPSRVHVSCQHPQSHIRTLHKLSIMLRVDNGDPSLGKRGQFDVCIETGLHVLSQHCQRENTLPTDPGPDDDEEQDEGQEITITEKVMGGAGLFTSRGERFDRRVSGF